MTGFETLLEEHEILFADGATGTNYFACGLEAGYPPELWNTEKPDAVEDLHRRFFGAGSDIVLTNTFGGTSYRLKLHGAEARVAELNRSGARLARKVADEMEAQTGRKLLVAGSMGPTGELFAPLGALTHDAAVAAFTEQATALAEGGADLLWVETLSSTEEFDAAMAAAKTTGLPVAATMTFDTAAKTMMGVAPGDYATHAGKAGAAALGANCGVGPSELMHTVMEMAVHSNLPLIAKGNCGIPEYRDGAVHYRGSPEMMALYAVFARDAGVKIIGGCCGTTPEHIAAMKRAIDATPKAAADAARLAAELGTPWAGIGGNGNDNEKSARPRRNRRRRA